MNPLARNSQRVLNNASADELNTRISSLIDLYKQGQNPNSITQMLMQQNPNLSMLGPQYQNLVKGKNPREVLLQYAQQLGVNEQNLKELAQMFGVK